MAHQSLYRRYRPRRFGDVRGQEHVIKALRNAVANGTEGHAYLFSGPRGTGKTSTARILAKALNCPNLVDGEPCAECDSCLSIENGSSYDLFELDAASNNGVDAMRDLISRTVVGSPGRTKVYILDEVHMLSPAASNALLKTLEEPPDHVVFVLATTDPQKVLPTIRSRTQHFEFSLLSANELADYVRWIGVDANLDIDETAVAHVVRQGRGSARDTLSALDMVVAAGGVSDKAESIDEIVAALTERDTGRVMAAVADAVSQGREPRVLAENLLSTLRDAFLTSVNASLDHLSDADQARMNETARALGTATITRALESIGGAIVEMRQAADPRVPLEVALIKLTTPSASANLDDLLARLEDLERRVARGIPAAPAGGAAPAAAAPAPAAPAAASAVPAPAAPVSDGGGYSGDPYDGDPGPGGAFAASPRPVATGGGASSPAEIRAQLKARKGDAPQTPAPAAPAPAPAAPAPAPAPAAPAAAPAPVAAPEPEPQPIANEAVEAPAPAAVEQAPAPAPAPTTSAPPAPGRSIPSIPSAPDASAPAPSAPQAPAPQRSVPQPPAADPAPAATAAPAPAPAAEPAPAAPAPAPVAAPSTPSAAGAVTLEQLASAMTELVIPTLSGMNKSLFNAGRFIAESGGVWEFALDNAPDRLLNRAQGSVAEIEGLLSQRLGAPVKIHLTNAAGNAAPRTINRNTGGGASGAAAPISADVPTAPPAADDDDDDEYVDINELEDASDTAVSGIDKVMQAFPGSVVLEEE